MRDGPSFFNALKWSYIGNWGDKIFSAVFSLCIAGILGPTDFGIVSIAIVYVSFLQLFIDQGLTMALVQRKDLSDDHINTVFWTNLLLSVILFGASFPIGQYWAGANNAPNAAKVIPFLSLSIVLEALSIVQMALLKRRLDFKSISVRTNISVFLSGIAAIAVAVLDGGIWSLVIQQLVRDAAAVLLLWRMSTWRPSMTYSWRRLRELLPFSVPTFVAQIGIFFQAQAGTIILGTFFGPSAVGLYRVAERIVTSVISVATSATQAVSLPEFSRHQDNPPKLKETAYNCIRISAIVTVPALAGVAVVSNDLMAAIGPKWIMAANVLQVLSVLGAVQIFSVFTGPLLQSLAKTNYFAALEWGRTAASIAALLVAALAVRHASDNAQVMGIAIARLILGSFVITPVFVGIFMRLSGLKFKDFVAAISPSVITAVAIVAAVSGLGSCTWMPTESSALRLGLLVLIGALFGIPAILSLDLQLRAMALRLINKDRSSADSPRGAI